jgi:hypothetical protein
MVNEHEVTETGPKDFVKEFGLKVEGKNQSPLFKDRATAEKFSYPWNPGQRAYGALPHLKPIAETLESFKDEARYFSKTYTTKEAGAPSWRDESYGEGMILFEAKFGKKLSEFAEEILAKYPPLPEEKPGKELSIFGLSGSGKSTALEAIHDLYGSKVVEMDSDTVRFNLLARMVRDVEIENGASLDEVRQNLIHNKLSGPLYLLLNHLTKELKSRGYSVIRSSTMPEPGSDLLVYIAHPDGVDPRKVRDEEIPTVGKTLFDRTQTRVQGDDNYDWDNAETITRFEDMKPVTVRVPERVHGIFIKNLRGVLTNPPAGLLELSNQRLDDPEARKAQYRTFFKNALDKMK